MPPDVLLDVIAEVQGLLDLDEFRRGLITGLRRAVPAEWVSLNDIGPDPDSTTVLIDPEFPAEAHAVFARLAHENPLIARYQRTLDGRAYRFSDVVTPAQLRSLALYREFYGPLGLNHQIAFTLPSGAGRLLGVALSRRRRDFTRSEQRLLNRARPFLIQAYRTATDHTNLVRELAQRRQVPTELADAQSHRPALLRLGLTQREAEIVTGIAVGSSSVALAARLGISERTVQKHLQRCYRKLEVRNRSEAAELVWSLSATP